MMSDESLAALLGDATVQADGEVAVQRVRIQYRHKKIAWFATGEDNPSAGHYRFEFKDHILTIEGTQEEVEKKNAEFLRLAQGFMMVDKINIVRIREVENEIGLDDARVKQVVRGPVSTADVTDKPVDQTAAAPAAPKPVGFNFKVGG